MTPTRQSLSIEEIKRLGLKILTQSLGYQQKEAEVILSVLLYAELRGNSQGLIKLVTDSLVTQATQNTCTIAKETTFSAVVHGNKRCGLLVLSDATNLAIQKAKQHGVSVITVNDYCKSSSRVLIPYHIH
jgi:LDH2 family malate/lactate/ureidoglycolate dehydrogenase